MSASTILPPPLKHDTSCLMGCLLNDTVIKWACLLAAPHPPLKHDTSCLPHSLPTHEDWYIWKKSSQFIAKNQSFWKHSNIMRFLLASLSDPVWSFNDCNIFRWYYIGKISLILESPPPCVSIISKIAWCNTWTEGELLEVGMSASTIPPHPLSMIPLVYV